MNGEIRKRRPPLRVALFSGNYNYVMDGSVRALNRLVAFLEKEGSQVLVFSPTAGKAAFAHAGRLVSVPSVPVPGKRGEYRIGLGLRGSARRELDAFAPDLIHIAAPDYTARNALDYARKKRIPAVASFHTRFDTYLRYYHMQWLEKGLTAYMRHLYGRCEHVYVPSESMAAELKRDRIGRRIRLWTRGVDRDLFNPARRSDSRRERYGFSKDDVVVAFVGRLVLEKNIDVFADAFMQARRENPALRALVAGEGPERDRFRRNIPDGVFPGHLEGEELAQAYAGSDIFLNPSITETFGNVTLEAMASGLACVCARSAGSISLIEDGVNGYLASSTEEFARRIGSLAADRNMRSAFGKAGRMKSGEFRWDTVLAGIVEHYHDALAGYVPDVPPPASCDSTGGRQQGR